MRYSSAIRSLCAHMLCVQRTLYSAPVRGKDTVKCLMDGTQLNRFELINNQWPKWMLWMLKWNEQRRIYTACVLLYLLFGKPKRLCSISYIDWIFSSRVTFIWFILRCAQKYINTHTFPFHEFNPLHCTNTKWSNRSNSQSIHMFMWYTWILNSFWWAWKNKSKHRIDVHESPFPVWPPLGCTAKNGIQLNCWISRNFVVWKKYFFSAHSMIPCTPL